MTTAQSQPQPQEGRGTDPDRWVAAVVDAFGLSSRIEVRTGWQRQVPAEELSAWVMLTVEQAVADVAGAWSKAVDLNALRSSVDPSALPGPQPSSSSSLQQAQVFGGRLDADRAQPAGAVAEVTV